MRGGRGGRGEPWSGNSFKKTLKTSSVLHGSCQHQELAGFPIANVMKELDKLEKGCRGQWNGTEEEGREQGEGEGAGRQMRSLEVG